MAQGIDSQNQEAIVGASMLLASDFDDTQFLTSKIEEGVVTVDGAYATGIAEALGPAAAQRYIDEGGHRARTPAEIVQDLAPDALVSEVELLAQAVAHTKMGVLFDQIGKPLSDGVRWPRPSSGFSQTWEQVGFHQKSSENAAVTAVLSAGHVPFISRTFEVHGLKQPDVFVTDDLMVEEYGYAHLSPEDRAKPSPLFLRVASGLWLSRLGVTSTAEVEVSAKDRTIYVGDSLIKDGGLAANYGVQFVHLEAEKSHQNWQEVRRWLALKASDSVGASA